MILVAGSDGLCAEGISRTPDLLEINTETDIIKRRGSYGLTGDTGKRNSVIAAYWIRYGAAHDVEMISLTRNDSAVEGTRTRRKVKGSRIASN